MSFDLPADLEIRVARYAEESRVSPDEAVRQLVEDGLRRTKKGPRPSLRSDDPERTIGLFADVTGFIEVMEKVISSREERYSRDR